MPNAGVPDFISYPCYSNRMDAASAMPLHTIDNHHMSCVGRKFFYAQVLKRNMCP